MTPPNAAQRAPLLDARIRVVVVDDHEILRKGISALLDEQHDIEVVGEAARAVDAIAIAASTRPHVALLDVRLGADDPMGGIHACRAIASAEHRVACAMLTDDGTAQTRRAAREAGASGFLLKHLRGSGLVDAVRRLAGGEQLTIDVSPERETHLKAAIPKDMFATLTAQEHRILENITTGMTNRQIALVMNLAEKTVKNYVSNVLAKLGMERRTEVAVMWAVAAQYAS